MSPNSYCLDDAGGLDAGSEIARVMAAEARFAERAEQILKRFEAKKVERLIGDFELACASGPLPPCPWPSDPWSTVMMTLVDQLLNQVFDS